MIFKAGDKVKFHVTAGPNKAIKYGVVVEIYEDTNKVEILSDGDIETYIVDSNNVMIDFERSKKPNCYDDHYSSMSVQPIVLMQMCMTPAEFKGFLKGNIIKYMLRAGHKQGECVEKELQKANRYREWLLEAEAGLWINPKD